MPDLPAQQSAVWSTVYFPNWHMFRLSTVNPGTKFFCSFLYTAHFFCPKKFLFRVTYCLSEVLLTVHKFYFVSIKKNFFLAKSTKKRLNLGKISVKYFFCNFFMIKEIYFFSCHKTLENEFTACFYNAKAFC